MAIFLTGDTHGDFSRFRPDIFYEQIGLTKDDCTIICGDFGGIWDGSPEEQGQLDWLEQRPYTTLFVSGNHENYDLLAQYPVEEWRAGAAGSALEPDDPLFKKKCRRLNARGAMYRVNHQSWWAAELPSEEEYQTARDNLGKHGWEVDYIITHCCPSSVQDELSSGFYQADALTDFLDEIAQRCRFRYQFFGHYHTNKVIREKFVLLYEQIIKLKL